jgi:hypothetical protein
MTNNEMDKIVEQKLQNWDKEHNNLSKRVKQGKLVSNSLGGMPAYYKKLRAAQAAI